MPTRESVTAKTKFQAKDKDGNNTGEPEAREVTFTIETPDNLAEARKMYGDELVFNVFNQKLIVHIQNAARSLINGETPATPEQVQEAMDQWQLSEKSRTRLTPEQRAERLASGRSAAEIDAMIARLTAEREARAAAA